MQEEGVTLMVKNSSRIFAQNYSGARFIVPTRDPIPGPSPDPGPAGYILKTFKTLFIKIPVQIKTRD